MNDAIGNDGNRFLAAHMRRRELGPLPYWGGRWAQLVLGWDPWKLKRRRAKTARHDDARRYGRSSSKRQRNGHRAR